MVFFTRELYEGVQPESGWERRAEREWHKRFKFYRRYEALIAPLLPASVVRLSRETLHDALVEFAEQGEGRLALIMDARRALGGFRGRRVRLTFRGVRRRVRTRGLVGRWWLYEEVHLCSHAKFNLQVLLTGSELEIEADALSIQKV